MQIKDFFINFWKNYKILSLCILISFAYFFHNSFLVSKTYTSTSIIAIKDNNQGLTASSLFSLISVPPAALQQLQEFLESDETNNLLAEEFFLESIFTSTSIDPFSRFNTLGISSNLLNQSFGDYLQNMFTVTINREANTIEISTTAFKPDEAKIFNLAIVSIANYYFTRKKNLSAQITKVNQECEYLLSKSYVDDIELNNVSNPKKEVISEVKSANDLLLALATKTAQQCQEIAKENELNVKINKPIYVDNLTAENIRSSLRSIFRNSVDLLTNSDNLVIISEPQIPKLFDNKRIALQTLVLFFTLVLSLFSLDTLRKILFEFK